MLASENLVEARGWRMPQTTIHLKVDSQWEVERSRTYYVYHTHHTQPAISAYLDFGL